MGHNGRPLCGTNVEDSPHHAACFAIPACWWGGASDTLSAAGHDLLRMHLSTRRPPAGKGALPLCTPTRVPLDPVQLRPGVSVTSALSYLCSRLPPYHPADQSRMAQPLTPRPFADLTGRTAVITGSSSGIGQAIAPANSPPQEPTSSSTAAGPPRSSRGRGWRVRAARPHRLHPHRRRRSGIGTHSLRRGQPQSPRKTRHLGQQRRSRPPDRRRTKVALRKEAGDAPRRRRPQPVLLSREVGRRMQEAGQGVILNILGWDQADRGMDGGEEQRSSSRPPRTRSWASPAHSP